MEGSTFPSFAASMLVPCGFQSHGDSPCPDPFAQGPEVNSVLLQGSFASFAGRLRAATGLSV